MLTSTAILLLLLEWLSLCPEENLGEFPHCYAVIHRILAVSQTHKRCFTARATGKIPTGKNNHTWGSVISQPFRLDSNEIQWRTNGDLILRCFYEKKRKKSHMYLLYKVSDLINVLRFVKIPNTAITVRDLNMIFINLCFIALFPFSLFLLNNPELWLIVRNISGWSQVKRSSVWFRSVILCYNVFHV